MSALGSLFTEDFMSLRCIDPHETDGLILFRPKSVILKTIDLERVKEKAENIFNFYLDSNWEFRFICQVNEKLRILEIHYKDHESFIVYLLLIQDIPSEE